MSDGSKTQQTIVLKDLDSEPEKHAIFEQASIKSTATVKWNKYIIFTSYKFVI